MRLLPIALILCLATTAAAQTLFYEVPLTGDQEAPPVVTTGTGMAAVTLDPTSGFVTVEAVYRDMSSDVNGAHLHGPAPRGRNANVLIALTHGGGTMGFFGGTGTLSGAQIDQMLAGETYLNVHTTTNAGGEIRGQVDSIQNTGQPGAQLVDLTGEARPGGNLQVHCPPGSGQDFIVVGLALAPGQVFPLDIPELCPPTPVGVGLDLAGPVIAFPGSVVNLPLPPMFPPIDLAIQCASITPTNCVTLSGARRVAVR